MAIDTERFLGKFVFWNAMKMISRCHRPPTDVECGMDVGARPFKNGFQFVPIVDLFKLQRFNGRSCDDETVKLLVLNLVPRFVE